MSHLQVVTGTAAITAIRRSEGIELVSPSVVKHGRPLFVVLDRGSREDALFQRGFNGVVQWYAVRSGGMTLYRTPLLHYSVAGGRDLFEFGMPQGMVSGTYQLVLLSPKRASAKGMGFLNGASGGDFEFQVQ